MRSLELKLIPILASEIINDLFYLEFEMLVSSIAIGYCFGAFFATISLIPLLIYCLLLLKKNGKKAWFVKRRPKLVAISLISSAIPAISVSYIMLSRYMIDPDSDQGSQSQQIAELLIWSIHTPSVFISLGFYIIRFWLLYYDTQLAQVIKNREWRMAINPNTASNNWFLKPQNQRIFGNDAKYLIIMNILITIVVNVIACVSWVATNTPLLGVIVYATIFLLAVCHFI